MKKMILVCCLLLAYISCLTFIYVDAAGAQQYKFKIGNLMTRQHPGGQGIVRVAEAAEQLSKGRIKIDVFEAAQLGGELDMVSQVRMGSLDMAMIGSGIVASVEPTFSITELPFIWKSDENARKILDGPIGQKVLRLLEAKGIKGIGWGEWGFRGFLTNKKPLEKPEDLKGLKIRVIENPLYITTLRTFGANAVPMAWPEVYTALDQGTIDGVETNYSGMYDTKLYEVTKCLAVTNHIYTALVVMMNNKTFNSLPQDVQQIIIEACKMGGARTRETAAKANNDAIEFMTKRGHKVTRPDPKPFEALVPAVYKRFTAQVGQDLINEVMAAQK